MSALIEHLEHEGRALSQKVLARMYRDPFWTERYGDRGRRHADEDSDFHLRYLSRALAAGDAGVLRRYAVWLRDLLNARGMCTRHLDENFRLLAAEIAAQAWPDRERAIAFLEEARAALDWPAEELRTLKQDTERIAEAVARRYAARRPNGWKRDERGDDALRDDAANYVSYIADALAAGKADTLIAHTRWFATHARSRGLERDDVIAFLHALREELASCGAPAQSLAFLDEASAIP